MGGGLTRREALRLSGLTLASMALRPLERLVLPPVLARGAYLDGPKTGVWAEIVGTRGYNYVVNSTNDTEVVPIEKLKILEGWPFPLERLSDLGWRNDAPYLMDWVPRLGGSMVRINAPLDAIETGSDVDRAMTQAKISGLERLVVFNTQKFDEGYIRERARVLTRGHSSIYWEIGNEPDNREVLFWKDQDPRTYARFVAVTMEEARGEWV